MAANDPAWAIAFFGILYAGAVVVPVDAATESDPLRRIVEASGATALIGDNPSLARVGARLPPSLTALELDQATREGPPGSEDGARVRPGDLAVLLYTSGTTGSPKGVMLSHHNFASLVASLGPLFPLTHGDRLLSVLPLHHTFELTCGLLLPLSRGARVVYLGEIEGERLVSTLRQAKITALIGVPALWQAIERRIKSRIESRGPLAARGFDFVLDVQRTLHDYTGIDTGKLLFGGVHAALGGHLKYLVSGGAQLPAETQRLFAGLGLHLREGYGLTEAAPVLTVAAAKGRRGSHVGRPVPGVEVRVDEPDAEGVGEVLARGPNVMLGYFGDEEGTRAVLSPDGWLRTGDLGKLDSKGNLTLVGRSKDVIVGPSGENVYPDDVERVLGTVDGVAEYALVGVMDAPGAERIACVARPAMGEGETRGQAHERARASLQRAFSRLVTVQRPGFVYLVDSELPKTVTRKVKRQELRMLVERIRHTGREASDAVLGPSDKTDEQAIRLVRAVVAGIARRRAEQVRPDETLRGDLGFDSLMMLELLVSLEGQVGHALDASALSECERVEEVVGLVTRSSAGPIAPEQAAFGVERPEDSTFELPVPLRAAAMHWLGQAQSGFYGRVMRTRVEGSAHVPRNTNFLVVANHASHLDMGLVKYALGAQGRDLHSLAAQDYFFEGGALQKAYFENLTNLVPLTRTGALRQGLRQAGKLLEQGHVVLLFPEGTRSLSGELGEFKPLAARLALEHGVDILPMWLGGTYRALPKGAKFLQSRDLVARIGKPISIERFRGLAGPLDLSVTDHTRLLARILKQCVMELGRGALLDLDQLDERQLLAIAETQLELPSMKTVFSELERRFVKGSVKNSISYYFSLGEREKWTLWVDPVSCRVAHGKAVDVADCVLKTSPDLFTKIVRDRYLPGPSEFLSGAVKSNNIPLLVTFQRAFQLSDSPPLAGE